MSETIQTKICSKCKLPKPISEFNKSRSEKDGLQYKCKTCIRQYHKTEKYNASQKRYQQTGKYKVYQKTYRQSKEGKLAQKRYRQSKKGKATRKTTALRDTQRFMVRHPNQVKAVQSVNQAIQAGKLPRPNTRLCHYCPKPAQQYHHWHGYEPEHWLDVIPICLKCHDLSVP